MFIENDEQADLIRRERLVSEHEKGAWLRKVIDDGQMNPQWFIQDLVSRGLIKLNNNDTINGQK